MEYDKEIKYIWISVSEQLPPVGIIVETKIQSDSMGDWCFIKRTFNGEHWKVINDDYTEFNEIRFNPTHWRQ
jgi:hypothetical protein